MQINDFTFTLYQLKEVQSSFTESFFFFHFKYLLNSHQFQFNGGNFSDAC